MEHIVCAQSSGSWIAEPLPDRLQYRMRNEAELRRRPGNQLEAGTD
jgi:hypothetical protein